MRLKRGLTMDSGASANVMPRRLVLHPKKIRPSPGSIRGVKYVAANNGVIKNEGEYDFEFETKGGESRSITMQIANVNKALASVAHFVDNGYTVIFEKNYNTGEDRSRMVLKKTGEETPLLREKNVWILDAYIAKDQGFLRPGAR